MVNALEQKIVAITPPGAIVDNASLTTNAIDTKGWDWLTVIVFFGAMDIAVAALKMQCSDTDSAYADADGLNFATDGSLPTAGDDNHFFAFQINLKGKKRFWDLVATMGDGAAGTYVTAFGILSRGNIAPSTAALRGFTQELVA